jgi:dihydropteroate synthase
MRPRFQWQLRSRTLELGARTLVMGVVNVTPDSFSDGGMFLECRKATEHALRLLEEGADIIDIGGESTRPGKKEPVSAQQEQDRVLPVIEALHKQASHAIISIDTYRAATAQAAVAAGAEIVNDVSGLKWDESMASALAQLKCGVVLMHTRGRPEEWKSQPPLPQPTDLVKRELAKIAAHATSSGIDRERIVLDPGFGFGKVGEENFALMARLHELAELGYPLLSGTSRKSFLKVGDSDSRLPGSIATAVMALKQGAHIVRVHDVRETVEAVRVADAILAAASDKG